MLVMRPAAPPWASRLALAASAFLALVVMVFCSGLWVVALQWFPAGGPAAAPVQRAASLPARVGAPSPWTSDVEQAPLGAASVLYTSDSWLIDEPEWFAGLVGRGADDYRLTDRAGVAGIDTVLSPDGTRLSGPWGVMDLGAGWVAGCRGFGEQQRWAEPQAWSPDGRSLAYLTGGAGEDSSPARLMVLDTAGGASREIAQLSAPGVPPGWTAAFSPDGARLAFQSGDRLRVRALAGGATTDLPLPPGARLAGKGAWSREGRSLLVVSGERCDCAGHPVRWTVTAFSAADGAVTGPSWSRDGVYALRVLGWWPSGRPVAVEHLPADGAEPVLFGAAGDHDPLSGLDGAGAARLIELGTSRVLLTGDEWSAGGDVGSLDVPDAVLAAGVVRPGDPPLWDLDPVAYVLVVLIVAALLTLLVVVGRWIRAGRADDPGEDQVRGGLV
jgi:hypothetical protein